MGKRNVLKSIKGKRGREDEKRGRSFTQMKV